MPLDFNCGRVPAVTRFELGVPNVMAKSSSWSSVGFICALTNAWFSVFCHRGMNRGCGTYLWTME